MFNESPPLLNDDEEDVKVKANKKMVLPQGILYTRDRIKGNRKAKGVVYDFIKEKGYYDRGGPVPAWLNTLVVWGPPGTGKTSICYLTFRDLGVYAHTLENMTDEGKKPIVDSMEQVLLTQKGHIYFLLDHLSAECYTASGVKTIVDFVRGKRNITVVIGVDNLYDSVMYPLRAAQVGSNRCVCATKFSRLWENEITAVLRNKKLTDPSAIQTGIDVANGDARQAATFAEWHLKTADKCFCFGKKQKVTPVCACQCPFCIRRKGGTHTRDAYTTWKAKLNKRDIVFNPFEICHTAFQGNKVLASTAPFNTLFQMVSWNYPDWVQHKGGDVCTQLDSMSMLAEAMSTVSILRDGDMSKSLLLSGCAVEKSHTADFRCSWPTFSNYQLKQQVDAVRKVSNCLPCVSEFTEDLDEKGYVIETATGNKFSISFVKTNACELGLAVKLIVANERNKSKTIKENKNAAEISKETAAWVNMEDERKQIHNELLKKTKIDFTFFKKRLDAFTTFPLAF